MTTASAELPVHLTRFIGRDRELDELARMTARARLVTLTGAGGSGKTRLAAELAARAGSAFGRVAWVDLAPLTDPQYIAQHVADALKVPQRAGPTPLDLLVEFACEQHLLIVLDNCEHLVEASAALADGLLRGCPRVALIATSREALGVVGETAWLVPPLASAEAVQLFVERAQEVSPTFTLTEANTAAVHEICSRLDGLPLAIELAAARVRVLSPEQIAQRLDDAFRLLSIGNRTSLPRHRTLRATMEWSFALLAEREQVLLRRLAVFAGSFTLDAAEAVCVGEGLQGDDILDGVTGLVDKSLVLMEVEAGEARYRLLETVRQYGTERLEEANELEPLQRRCCEHFLGVLEAAAPTLVGGSNDPVLLARLVREQDNLRASAAWACADRARSQLALRFVGVVFWFWYALALFREARELTDRAMAMMSGNEPPLLRGRAFMTSGLTALAQGDYPRSRAEFTAALPLLREAGDQTGAAAALAKLGAATMLGGDVPGAIRILDEAVTHTAEWHGSDVAVVFARFWRGWAAYAQGQFDLAYELIEPNVRHARAAGLLTSHAHSVSSVARIEFARGHIEKACELMTEAIECELAINDGWGIALAMDVAPLVAARRGRHEDATLMLAGIEAHRARLAMATPGIAPLERQQVLAQLRQSLGKRFDELYAAGAALSTDDLVQRAFAEAARHTAEHPAVRPVAAAVAADGSQRLRVLALGALQVFVGGRAVESAAWGSARPRELLIYLLLHPEGRTKEQVGLAFWPDASTAQLRNSFHVTLHRLRKALGGAEWVVLEGERYRIAPERLEEFDAPLFEQAVTTARAALKRQQPDAAAKVEQALSLFRGDLLDGEPVGDWHLEHRDRLQRIYVDTLMELAGQFVREGRHEKAAEAYRRVLARDPVHEEALRGVMRCHEALGERAQALRIYKQFADRLRAELEAEPHRETVRLYEKLQQGVGV